eukprot:Hpha_TRINITY_DN4997_c0_g1::TRINITY_DN4997_c0_g1_i1::g.51443::m.51443
MAQDHEKFEVTSTPRKNPLLRKFSMFGTQADGADGFDMYSQPTGTPREDRVPRIGEEEEEEIDASMLLRKSTKLEQRVSIAYDRGLLAPVELQGYRRLFGVMDEGMEGTITIEDLLDVCSFMHVRLTREEMEMRFQAMDNGDGRVELDEFILFFTCAKLEGIHTYVDHEVDSAIQRIKRQRELEEDMKRLQARKLQSASVKQYGRPTLQNALDVFRLIICVYYGFLVPFTLAADAEGRDGLWSSPLLALEIVWTVVLCIDFVVVFWAHLGRKARKGLVRKKSPGRLMLHGLCVPPLDLIGRAIGNDQLRTVGMVMRLGCAVKMDDLFAVESQNVSLGVVVVIFEVLPVMRGAFWTLLSLHFSSCLFIVLSPCGDSVPCEGHFGDRYLEALYWVLYTLSTVGYGDVAVKTRGARILAMVLFVYSVLINAYFLGKITSMISIDPDEEHRESMSKTRQLLANCGVSQEVREDVLAFQHYLLGMKMSLSSFKTLFGELPVPIQDDLSLYIRVEQLALVPLFAGVSPKCQVALAVVLRSRILARGQCIAQKGTSAERLEFITHGFAEVLTDEDEFEVKIAARGACFGAMELLGWETSFPFTVRTISYTELMVLGREDFQNLTRRFPSLEHHLAAALRPGRGSSFVADELTEEDIYELSEELGIADAIAERLCSQRANTQTMFSFMSEAAVDEYGYGEDEMARSMGKSMIGKSPNEKPIRFYGFAGQYGQLCSFWPAPFEAAGYTWPSLEHYFQGMKFEDDDIIEMIINASSPEEARAIGRDPANKLRENWDAIRIQIMYKGLLAKHTQVSSCKNILLGTGHRKLVFADLGDEFWGIGSSSRGKNMMGLLLMRVREDVRSQAQSQNVEVTGITGEYGKLSNSYPLQLQIDGAKWATVEHYIQAARWQGTRVEALVAQAPTPEEAIRIGAGLHGNVKPREDWAAVRDDMMRNALRVKFTSDTTCRAELLHTGSATIECSHPDTYWGGIRAGANQLGQHLMELRDELNAEDEAERQGGGLSVDISMAMDSQNASPRGVSARVSSRASASPRCASSSDATPRRESPKGKAPRESPIRESPKGETGPADYSKGRYGITPDKEETAQLPGSLHTKPLIQRISFPPSPLRMETTTTSPKPRVAVSHGSLGGQLGAGSQNQEWRGEWSMNDTADQIHQLREMMFVLQNKMDDGWGAILSGQKTINRRLDNIQRQMGGGQTFHRM